MKLHRLLLPTSALAGAALLLAPRLLLGYDTSGETLPLALCDVRVFDNFTDPTANDNTTPDPDWPGYVGAELAIWKAASEWGSMLHGGTGAGDPLQTVGSGGANFEFSWQGRATGVGGFNDNIHSEISGAPFGTMAYLEGSPDDGWRARYVATYTWDDGPGSISGNGEDLQGVATMMHGFALGLLHSQNTSATMYQFVTGSGEDKRSIEADDIAGVQSLYGVKWIFKPTITGVTVSSGNVTILGSDFSLSNNEVWFTQAGSGGTGDPVKVSGLSSNGSSITLAIPFAAGPGDVLVRTDDGTSFASLSNAWPIDTGPNPCEPTAYCTAKLSSSQCLPSIGFNGAPSFSSPGTFTIHTSKMEIGVSAIAFFGTTGQATIPFQGGLICAASPIYRLGGKFTGGHVACEGLISYTLQDVMDHGAGGPLVVPGGKVYIQSWGRDLADPFGSSLSNALEITVCP